MNIFSTRIIDCSACGSKNLKKILTIPNLSHVGVYCHNKDEEKNYPPVNNSLNICTKCGHGQLANALDPNFLYNKNFQHCTSCSMIARNANNWLYEFIIKSRAL